MSKENIVRAVNLRHGPREDLPIRASDMVSEGNASSLTSETKDTGEHLDLKVTFQSRTKGYIKSPDLRTLTSVTGVILNGAIDIQASVRHWIFTSLWIRLYKFCIVGPPNRLAFYGGRRHRADDVTVNDRPYWSFCPRRLIFPALYRTHVLRVVFVHVVQYRKERVRMLFSFHEDSALLAMAGRYLYNCSVPQWSDFRQHLHCNLRRECAGGEDEAGCFFDSPSCGRGMISAAGGCYKYVDSRDVDGESLMSWYDAHDLCRREGGYLVSLNTPEEWDAVLRILQRLPYGSIFGGLGYLNVYHHLIYRDILVWADDSVMYYGSLVDMVGHRSETDICSAFAWTLDSLIKIKCLVPGNLNALCEMKSRSSPGISTAAVAPPNITSDFGSISVIECPSGHKTHTSLACDARSACWGRGSGLAYTCDAPLTSLPPRFECTGGLEYAPYSLLCDFRYDCTDGSDEDFCVFPPCDLDPFPCGNKQCIRYDRQCDGTEDCTNGYDEQVCREMVPREVARGRLPYGIRRGADGGYLTVHTGYRCEDADFKCHSIDICMPLYLRCNRIKDCPGHEDELGCDTCPGFFRCRSSSICLHPVSTCDGIPDCPQHDDERFCELSCPEHCACHALSARCRRRFSAVEISDLRFLEARGSGMTLSDLVNKTFLIHLGLAGCALLRLGNAGLPNLRYLDVSDNLLTNITYTFLLNFPNLRALLLDGNPLDTVFLKHHHDSHRSLPIVTLSLSRAVLKEIDVDTFTVLSNLEALNLSGSGVERVSGPGLGFLTELTTLDVRGCSLTFVPRKFIRDLRKLEVAFADNYKLCCPAMLPEGFSQAQCYAPSDEISSCDALLGSSAYRVMLSVFAVLALLGNFGSFAYRVFISKSHGDLGFRVFVTHLNVSDLMMGVYLAVVGVTDRLYFGKYLWVDNVWRNSAVCSAAGCLSFVSSQVSAFIICLITLDRFLALRFPFGRLRFRRRSAHVAACVAWTVGVVLAAVPLLPMTSHWKFYSQNGACLPLPLSQGQLTDQSYSFNVMVVFNLVLFLFVVAGQICIYHTVRISNEAGVADARTTSSENADLARRLVTVAVSNSLCSVLIGVLGLLASSGTQLTAEVRATIVIVALPVNAALNPYLYCFNTILEHRRRENEQRIRKILMAAQAKRAVVPPSHTT